ncbi:hypothetical protein [Sediminibacterium sp.]|uniref:hypothetical protein n=1 Tax=Sediminibacterium sp. TaxID=1917865 RepID=UPI0027346CFB|nr:hypothetical protein [Sediminibacterium sp.]MDP3392589.1 hypothetical protein [Sediminibacterium sp.]MDP3566168.1 hypothetical protein [Sediminibacterium sp.]
MIYLRNLLLLSVLFIASCKKDDQKKDDLFSKLDNYTKILSNSPKDLKSDLKILIETRNQIAKRILQNGIKKKTIINSLENGNIAELKTESGISNEEFDLLINKMEEIKLLLTSKYPEVDYYLRNASKSCESCETSKQIAYVNNIPTSVIDGNEIINYNSATALSTNPEEIGADCRWVAYTACLLVCTTTGPVIYWICAALCVDTYCTFN